MLRGEVQGFRAHGLAAAIGLWLTAAPVALAAPGDLDPSFSGDGITRIRMPDAALAGTAIAIAPDGGLVAGGTRTTGGDFDPDERAGIVLRLRADGSVDPSFGDEGTAVIKANPGFQLMDVAVQPDGKIVAVGYLEGRASFGPFPGVAARLTAGGELDPTFAGDGIATFELPAFTNVEIDAAGRIVAGGASVYSASLSSTTGLAVARLLPDGSPDPGYSEDGYALAEVGEPLSRGREEAPSVGLALDQQGRATIGAGSQYVRTGNRLFRFTEDGSPDDSFGDDGMVALPGTVADTAPILGVATDGRLLAALDDHRSFELTANGVLELGPDGELDPQRAVRLGDVNPRDMAVGDGIAMLAGSRADSAGNGWDFGIAAVAPGPGLDQGYGEGGLARVRLDAAGDAAEAVAFDGQGRAVVAGYVTRTLRESDLVVARLERAPGAPDKDADQLTDPEDRCPLRFGPSADDGCPTARRTIKLRVDSIVSHGNRPEAAGLRGTIRTRSNSFCAKSGKVTVMRTRPGQDERLKEVRRGTDGYTPPFAELPDITEYKLRARVRWPIRGLYARVGRSFSGVDGACEPARARVELP